MASPSPAAPKYTTMHRVLLGMSVFDLVADAWFFVGTWALPVGTPNAYDPRGNDATCTSQGFFLQSGLSIPIYQMSLVAYYYLSVCKSWKEERQFKRYQWLFHLPPAIFGVTTALYGAIDDQFHPAGLWCFFAGTDQSLALIFGLFYAPLWLSFIITGVLMGLIYRHVRQQENRVARYTFVGRISSSFRRRKGGAANAAAGNTGGTTARRTAAAPSSNAAERKFSKSVLHQSVFYSTAFYLTFIFPTILRFYQLANPTQVAPPYPMLYLMGFFLPLQGFFNLHIYKRHAIQKFFRKYIFKRREGDDQKKKSKKQNPKTEVVTQQSQKTEAAENGAGGDLEGQSPTSEPTPS
jgi:hypothetical protein